MKTWFKRLRNWWLVTRHRRELQAEAELAAGYQNAAVAYRRSDQGLMLSLVWDRLLPTGDPLFRGDSTGNWVAPLTSAQMRERFPEADQPEWLTKEW